MAALDSEQAELLAAIVDTLVPEDENGPAGTTAGVDAYIESLILGSEQIRATYVDNLPALASLAVDQTGTAFQDLNLLQRTELLTAVQSGEVDGFTPNAATFFAILHHHMLEGFFGDPEHGGNRDMAGWKLIGYRGVRLIQTAEEQAIGYTDEAPIKSRREALIEAGL
jgi:hypothetical protein